ncbi:MAG: flavodoxin family protein [Candidatus Omnitrophica bacterium]|nr:flavodoxin family protein [Candidatus Omnitrophota bacterium]MBU4488201.1 flavodoxin family protein [Candidatus Omnitrophota bacterium]MCG2705396.1 flavodoxin family protein [Candidatus Omnitrophota bacterium]
MMKTSGVAKVLGINASPRKGGNTDIIIDKILEAAKDNGADTDKIFLNGLRLQYCQECEEPDNNGNCNFKDDMGVVYRKFKEADVVILASPIFFGSISGQAKMMIDRFQCAWRAKHILKKDAFGEKRIGAFIAVAASERQDFFENAKAIVKNLFATLNIEYKKELYFTGIDAKADILKHPDLLEKAYKLGEDLTRSLRNG